MTGISMLQTTTRHFALSLHSWRLLFAASFKPALPTVIDPWYSVQERVEGVECW